LRGKVQELFCKGWVVSAGALLEKRKRLPCDSLWLNVKNPTRPSCHSDTFHLHLPRGAAEPHDADAASSPPG